MIAAGYYNMWVSVCMASAKIEDLCKFRGQAVYSQPHLSCLPNRTYFHLPRVILVIISGIMGSIDTPLITVFGATGNQGGSVVRSLLQNPAFRVRALTRNPSSDAAKKLADAGAEVVGANGFSSEDMGKAFHGSWGVFVNINSDDKVCGLCRQ